jgi:heptose I phosphotransferase
MGVPDVRPLDEVLASRCGSPAARCVEPALLTATARAVADLHRAGLQHRDLFTKHLLIRKRAHQEPTVVFVDLTRLRRPRRMTNAHRARDLAALDASTARSFVSRTERLRWLRLYLEAGGETRDAVRPLLRRIARIRRRLARRRALRGYQ